MNEKKEMNEMQEAYTYYPEAKEIETWIGEIWEKAEQIPVTVEVLEDGGWRNNYGTFHMTRNRLIKFSPEGMKPFFGIWQPVLSGPSPLVVHLPGYGAELSNHPDIATDGYNLLNLSPLGYWTPDGMDVAQLQDQNWPVLPDTISTKAQGGYKDWLLNCVMAVKWAWSVDCVLPDRVSFYGTSQGGGTALLLGSVFKDRGTRCVAADEPFLTDYPRAAWRGAYGIAEAAFKRAANKGEAWHSLGFADTISHAPRMTYPVLLTEGGVDEACPPDTIDSLYKKLPNTTKSKTYLANRAHGYNYEFYLLARTWFRLYA